MVFEREPLPGHTPRVINKKRALNHFKIESSNNFPTASGLASSSSAYAAIALCLGDLFKLPLDKVKEIARLGSGSATRGCEGGLNLWPLGGVG